MISKIIEYFRPRPLTPSVAAALAAGEAQARRWGQDYVGVEHLLWGLMETLPFDDPDWDLLDPLAVCWETVKSTIVELGSEPQNRLQPTSLPRTPRCQTVLQLARKLARLAYALQVEVPCILQAIMKEAGSVAFFAIQSGITGVPFVSDSSPKWLANLVNNYRLKHGRAWELPRSSASKFREYFRPEFDHWKAEYNTSTTLVQSGNSFSFTTYLTEDPENMIRVLLRPMVSASDSVNQKYCDVYTATCNTLAKLAIGEISKKQFVADWPCPKKNDLGGLKHEFLAAKQPSGSLRLFQPADAQECRDIYNLLEAKVFVPSGYASEFDEWLQKADASQLVLEVEGRIVGCCGCTISEPFDPSKTVANVSRACSMSFGIIHPDFQRQGLGRTQLAVRLALAQHMKAPYVGLHATETSRPFLESAGFKFWRSYRSELGDLLHEGTLLLTDADTAVLGPWLALLSGECLELLRNPPATPAE